MTGAAAAPPVRFSGVRFAWVDADAPLLDGFNLELAPGCVTALVGPSGCGKSTLLRLAAGLLRPDAGTVEAGPGTRGDVGFVFQSPTLLPWLTVRENVALPLTLGADAPGGAVAEAIEQVGLGDAADMLPGALSGGMQMRVSLARALVTSPSLLLLDEPFGALDALTRRRVHGVFQRAWSARGATVLLVTHDIDEAVIIADHVVALNGLPLAPVGVFDVGGVASTGDRRYDPMVGQLARQIEACL